MDARTKILEAALGLLAKGGAQELTQTRICKAAGVRQSHLTYYFPTIRELLQGVAKYTLDSMTAEVAKRDPGQRPASLLGATIATSADKRRMRMVLGLVTTADREPKVKPRMREFLKEIRQGITPDAEGRGPRRHPRQVAFCIRSRSGRGSCSSRATTKRRARRRKRVLQMAIEFLRRKS